MKKKHAIAACTTRIRKTGSEIQLMPAGEFKGKDGRPGPGKTWKIDAALAGRVVALSAAQQTPFVIDYEHQTLFADKSGQPAPAAGWFSGLQWRDDGLYATGVEWTARATALIEADEYRYISPVFKYDPKTGEVMEVLLAGITNKPAIDGIADLAAARFGNDNYEEDRPEMDLKKLAAMLKMDEAADEAAIEAKIGELTGMPAILEETETQLAVARAQIAAPGTDPDPAKYVPVAVVSALQGDVAALTERLRKGDEDDLVAAGLADGRILPEMETWARSLAKKDVAALRSYLGSAKPIAALTSTQTGGKVPAGGEDGALGAEEIAVCRQMGVDPEEYKKTLAATSA